MVTVAVLDIIDVGRILPVLSEEVFGENIFQRVYCTLGVFHELTVAIFLVSMAVAVCVQAGKEQKVWAMCSTIIDFRLENILVLFLKALVINRLVYYFSIMEVETIQLLHWHRKFSFL